MSMKSAHRTQQSLASSIADRLEKVVLETALLNVDFADLVRELRLGEQLRRDVEQAFDRGDDVAAKKYFLENWREKKKGDANIREILHALHAMKPTLCLREHQWANIKEQNEKEKLECRDLRFQYYYRGMSVPDNIRQSSLLSEKKKRVISESTRQWSQHLVSDPIIQQLRVWGLISETLVASIYGEITMSARIEHLLSNIRDVEDVFDGFITAIYVTHQKKLIPDDLHWTSQDFKAALKHDIYVSAVSLNNSKATWQKVSYRSTRNSYLTGLSKKQLNFIVNCYHLSAHFGSHIYQGDMQPYIDKIWGTNPLRDEESHLKMHERRLLMALIKENYAVALCFFNIVEKNGQNYLSVKEMLKCKYPATVRCEFFQVNQNSTLTVTDIAEIMEDKLFHLSKELKCAFKNFRAINNLVTFDTRLEVKQQVYMLQMALKDINVFELFLPDDYEDIKNNWHLKITINLSDPQTDVSDTSLLPPSVEMADTSLLPRSVEMTDTSLNQSYKDSSIFESSMESMPISVSLGGSRRRELSVSNTQETMYSASPSRATSTSTTAAPEMESSEMSSAPVRVRQSSEQMQILGVLFGMIKDVRFNAFEFQDKVKRFDVRVDGGVKTLCDSYGKNLLHLIVEHQRISYLQVMFDCGLIQTMNRLPPKGQLKIIPYELAKKLGREKVTSALLTLIQWESKLTATHRAARIGDIERVMLLVTSDPTMKTLKDDYQNSTILYMAVISGSIELVKKLIAVNADVHCVTKSGDTLLTCAARMGHLELLQYLITDVHLDVNIPDNQGFSVVDHAIVNSDRDMFTYLMTLEEITLNKTKALIYMVSYSKVNFLNERLAENHVKITMKTPDNHLTPIMIAIIHGRLDMVEFLLNNGTDYRAMDKHQENIFHKLCENPNKDLTEFLIKEMRTRDALVDMLSQRNFASCKDQVELVTVEDHGRKQWFYVDVKRELKVDFLANVYGSEKTVLNLEQYGKVIEQGVGEPKKRNEVIEKYNKIQHHTEDVTPIMKALLYNLPELALQLLPHTVNPNQGDSNLLTPLHIAAMYGHKNVVMALCLKGVGADIVAKCGKNASSMAAMYGHHEVSRYINSVMCSKTAVTFNLEVLKKYLPLFSKPYLQLMKEDGADIKKVVRKNALDLQTELSLLFTKLGSSDLSAPSDAGDNETDDDMKNS